MKIAKELREMAVEVSDILACQEFNSIGCMPGDLCRVLGYPQAAAALCDVGWNAALDVDPGLTGEETNALVAQLLREGLEPTANDVKADGRFSETEFIEEEV